MSPTPVSIPCANVYMAKETQGSQFTIDAALKSNVKHIFIAGYNLHTLVTDKLEAVKSFLNDDHERTLSVLIGHPASVIGTIAFKQLFLRSPQFNAKTHLDKSVGAFRQLRKTYGTTRVKIRVAVLVPCGVWFAYNSLYGEQPDEDAIVVVTPLVNNGWESARRPLFAFSKVQHPEAFKYYWDKLVVEVFSQDGLSWAIDESLRLDRKLCRRASETIEVIWTVIKMLLGRG